MKANTVLSATLFVTTVLVSASAFASRTVSTKQYNATIAATTSEVALQSSCSFNAPTQCGVALDAIASYAVHHVCPDSKWYVDNSAKRGVKNPMNAYYRNIRGCHFPLVKELSADKAQTVFNSLSKHIAEAVAYVDPIDDVKQCDWQIDTMCSIVLDSMWVFAETGRCVGDAWYSDQSIHRNTPNPANSDKGYEIEGCMFPVVPFLPSENIQTVFDQISK